MITLPLITLDFDKSIMLVVRKIFLTIDWIPVRLIKHKIKSKQKYQRETGKGKKSKILKFSVQVRILIVFFCSQVEKYSAFSSIWLVNWFYRFLRSRTQKKVEDCSNFFSFREFFLFCFFIREQKYSQWKSTEAH